MQGTGRFNFGQRKGQQYPYVAWSSNLVANGTEQNNMSSVECNVLDSSKQFCYEVEVNSKGGTLRKVQTIRDSCSFQTLACRLMLEWYEYSDTKEVFCLKECSVTQCRCHRLKLMLK